MTESHRVKSHPLAVRIIGVSPSVALRGEMLSFGILADDEFNLSELQGCRVIRFLSFAAIQFEFGYAKRLIATINEGSLEAFLEGLGTGYRRFCLESAKLFGQHWSELLASDQYLAHSDFQKWSEQHSPPRPLNIPLLRSLKIEKQTLDIFHSLVGTPESRQTAIERHNENFISAEMNRYKELFDQCGHGLTLAQRRAVVINEDNNLIQAGAGSGKSETIVARTRYLIALGLCEPEEILLVAFNKKAAIELSERLERAGVIGPTVATMHALGNSMIQKALPRSRVIDETVQGGNARFVQIALESLSSIDSAFQKALLEFNLFWRYPVSAPHAFSSMEEYARHVKAGNLETITGQRVRSREEVMVANFLTSMNLRYVYEAPYQSKTDFRPDFRYQPDFFLPDHDIYIEHFAFDRQGRAPEFMGGQKYVERAYEKRELHLKGGTALLESHSWRLYEKDPFARLAAALEAVGIPTQAASPQDLLDLVSRRQELSASSLAKFVTQFNGLQKNARLSYDELVKRARAHTQSSRCLKFLDIQRPLLEKYQSVLANEGLMDFDDMILKATQLVKEEGNSHQFKQILVDEFQDASRGRAEFLNALRSQVQGSKLFCVGDDWQSIYRFAGSDVTCMTRFDGLFGPTKTTVLDRTFRFGDVIGNVSAEFVTRNPNQSRKTIQASPAAARFPIVVIYEGNRQDGVLRALKRIIESAAMDGATVYVLARYNRFVGDEKMRAYRRVVGNRLRIEGSSIHKAKGLEADFVIIDQVVTGADGFPSEKEDDPLLELVLGDEDPFPMAEERRLFYVALTRARQQVFIVTSEETESPFVKEIIELASPDVVIDGAVREQRVICPACESGFLVGKLRRADSGLFFTCSNGPVCDYIEDACPGCRKGVRRRITEATARCLTCGHESEICPNCHRGLLVKRQNKSTGERFLACSMSFSDLHKCKYTRSISTRY